MIHQKKNRSHLTSTIVKPRKSYSNGHLPYLWLAIRFKITTGYTPVFLSRILVYIRYVWA